MAKGQSSKSTSIAKQERQKNQPNTLTDHVFYGLTLDEEQKVFRDAIYSDKYDIVFCNAKAGTGKTLITIATAMLMVEYGMFDGIVYITAAGVHEWKQGLLPGTLEDKSKYSFLPLQQALIRIGYDPQRVIASESNPIAQKEGSAIISCLTDSYIRGVNIGDAENRVLFIIDESQNFTIEALRTVLSRVNEGSKVIVIGHSRQVDLRYPQDSGFVPFISHYSSKEKCKVCSLTHNYRGWVSAWADELTR